MPKKKNPPTSQRSDKVAAKQHRAALDAALAALPLSDVGQTLDQHTMLHTLDPPARTAVDAYLGCAFRGTPELTALVARVSELAPTAVRVKELLESVEVARHAASFATLAAKGHAVDVLYDLACGHGMVGVLLAYRFPRKRVVCVDLERRAGLDAFLAAWRELGEKAPGEEQCLSNLTFLEADLRGVDIAPRAVVVAVHACNDMNRLVIEAATVADAAWFVMPCCIRKGVYMPFGIRGESERGGRGGLDDAAHLLRCGVVAGRYGAQRIDSVDRRITNRHVFLQGGLSLDNMDPRAPALARAAGVAESDGASCGGAAAAGSASKRPAPTGEATSSPPRSSARREVVAAAVEVATAGGGIS